MITGCIYRAFLVIYIHSKCSSLWVYAPLSHSPHTSYTGSRITIRNHESCTFIHPTHGFRTYFGVQRLAQGQFNLYYAGVQDATSDLHTLEQPHPPGLQPFWQQWCVTHDCFTSIENRFKSVRQILESDGSLDKCPRLIVKKTSV